MFAVRWRLEDGFMLDGGEGVCRQLEWRGFLKDFGTDVVKDVVMGEDTFGQARNMVWDFKVSSA